MVKGYTGSLGRGEEEIDQEGKRNDTGHSSFLQLPVWG
jgi:hypothetical protein